MSNAPPTRSITLEIEIDAARDAAWRALTSPEELARWFPPISGGGSALGDKLLISWGEGMEWWTTIADLEPGRHLRWIDDPAEHEKFVAGERDKPVLAIDWHLETRGGKTVVRIVNSGFDASSDWDDHFHSTESGWRYFLFNLKHYLERHAGTPRALVWERRKSPVSRSELWTRLLGPNGFAVAENDHPTTGSARSFTLGGETYAAAVEHATVPTHLWLRIPALHEALLFIEAEGGTADEFHCGIWLSTYGLSDDRVGSLRSELSKVADRVFAPA